MARFQKTKDNKRSFEMGSAIGGTRIGGLVFTKVFLVTEMFELQEL